MVQTHSIHIRLPQKLMQEIKKILEKGYYSNINDFIKEAVREKVLNFEIPETKPEKTEESNRHQFHYIH